MAKKLPVTGSDVLRLDDLFNANVLKDAPAALQQNWMIVDNKHTSGHGVETRHPTFAAQCRLAAGSLSSQSCRDRLRRRLGNFHRAPLRAPACLGCRRLSRRAI